jgi:hypothetical protein
MYIVYHSKQKGGRGYHTRHQKTVHNKNGIRKKKKKYPHTTNTRHTTHLEISARWKKDQ